MKYLLYTMLLLITTGTACSQTVIPLYKDSIPNAKPGPDEEKSETKDGKERISNISRPTLTIFLPPADKATGTAVVICLGGGYAINKFTHEGTEVAKRFNEMGIAAFVLKYRLPSDKTMIDKRIGPLQDAQQAILLVREHAAEWGVNKNRVGILGFSAGGHLASTAGTHFEHHYIDVKKKTNLRPDFMVLVYPVISFADSLAHMGSRDNLLGKNPSLENIKEYSNELHVTKKTPPTFLVHAEDDQGVKVQNTLLFGEALQQNKVAFDFYLYEHGGHGFGLINSTINIKWMDLVQEWMMKNGWLGK